MVRPALHLPRVHCLSGPALPAKTKEVIYLSVGTNKLATTPLPFLLEVARERGLPDVISADHGPESALLLFVNIEGKKLKELESGMAIERPAFHFCQSVHNQSVEKFWIETNSRITALVKVRGNACYDLSYTHVRRSGSWTQAACP